MTEPRTEKAHVAEHDFLPVSGHPDDDECTYRADGPTVQQRLNELGVTTADVRTWARRQGLNPGTHGRIPTEQDEQVLRTGQPIVERLELFWRRPNVPVWGLTSKLPIRDAHGQVTGLIGISKDLAAPVSREDVSPEIARVLRYLESAYDDPVSPSLLARKAGMAAARFARVIKRIHGISPMQLITKTRITVGCRLLRETDASIAQIALDCGFADHSAFTRAFRAVTGMSPTEHRRLEGP